MDSLCGSGDIRNSFFTANVMHDVEETLNFALVNRHTADATQGCEHYLDSFE